MCNNTKCCLYVCTIESLLCYTPPTRFGLANVYCRPRIGVSCLVDRVWRLITPSGRQSRAYLCVPRLSPVDVPMSSSNQPSFAPLPDLVFYSGAADAARANIPASRGNLFQILSTPLPPPPSNEPVEIPYFSGAYAGAQKNKAGQGVRSQGFGEHQGLVRREIVATSEL